ncbi:MAG: GSCFA domain-containing protein [Crocinitomicaceae bacterium]
MKWFLAENFKMDCPSIEFGEKALFLGSCFAQNMLERGKMVGMDFQSTDFGTLFHPLPIARILSESITEINEFRIVQNNGTFSSFDSSTKLNAATEEEMKVKLTSEKAKLKTNLSEAKYLFITFGSAMAYKLMDEEYVVSNCHKLPASQFRKDLSELDELNAIYQKLIHQIKTINSTIQIVFTVSPVRHSKEGLVENNRSKARLLLLCEELEKLDNVHYFPAYEMVIDQLRDHRFFAEDLVHPNEQAIDFVWTKFQDLFFKEATVKLAKEVKNKRMFFQHKTIQPTNHRNIQLRVEKEAELKLFLKENPQIIW